MERYFNRMADEEINVEYDRDGVPLPTERDGNGYSTELTEYVYPKLNGISNNNEFSQQELSTYGLEESNGKINISTTRRLIKYLKAYAKLYADKLVTTINSEIDGKVDESDYTEKITSIESELGRLEGLINTTNSTLINRVYPVGCVYMSFQSTDPSTLFEGTSWLKLENRFLLGSGSKSVNSTGGEETHTLTIDEMPTHNHTQNKHYHTMPDFEGEPLRFLTATLNSDPVKVGSVGRSLSKLPSGDAFIVYTGGSNDSPARIIRQNGTSKKAPVINSIGESKAHENMPPYIVVHMWRRVS